MNGRSLLRWSERGLWLVGLAAVAIYLLAFADSKLFQLRAEQRLESELEAHQEARAARNEAFTQLDRTEMEAADEDAGSEDAGGGRGEEDEDPLIGRIEIPRVGVDAIVLDGVDRRTLRRSVGRIPGTARPGRPGNVGLAGHRDTFFAGLRDIREGDAVTLTTPDGTYRYVVESTLVVKPADTQVLAPSTEPSLTLVTCYPFQYVGPAPKRFIVRAREVRDGEAAVAP